MQVERDDAGAYWRQSVAKQVHCAWLGTTGSKAGGEASWSLVSLGAVASREWVMKTQLVQVGGDVSGGMGFGQLAFNNTKISK